MVDAKPAPSRKAALQQATAIAFESLYRRWAPQVRRWVKARGVVADVEDLVQEVFLVAHRRLSSFDGRNPQSWLYQIVRRKVRDYRRLRWTTTIQLGNEIPNEMPASATGPEDALDTHEKARALRQLLGTLSEKERQALILFELEGATGQNIADIQKIPINTVWARLRSARMHLRTRLEQVEPEWVWPQRQDPD